MKTPCIFVKNEKEFNHIKNCLIAFGYDTNFMTKEYDSKKNLIVLNFENIFGQVASLEDECNNHEIYKRYVVTELAYFVNEAASLKGTKYNLHRKDIMSKQNF